MATAEELDALIKAKGDEIRLAKEAKSEKSVIQPLVDGLLVSAWGPRRLGGATSTFLIAARFSDAFLSGSRASTRR
jgi:hypothetical protein